MLKFMIILKEKGRAGALRVLQTLSSLNVSGVSQTSSETSFDGLREPARGHGPTRWSTG